MTTQTESAQADLVALGRCEKMMKQTRCYGCDKPIEPEWLPVGEFIVCDECSSDTDKLSVEKLQEQLNTAKKALTESEKMYQKQMDRFLNSEMNESARSHCESQLKLLFPAHKAYEALAAIGGDDEIN